MRTPRRGRRDGIPTAGTPGAAAAKSVRGQPASAQRAVRRHCFGSIGRAGRLVAASADKEVGERELIEADRATQDEGHHAARKLAA